MKKSFGFLLALLILGGVAVISCPDKEAHKDAITKVVNEAVQEELGVKEDDDSLGILKGLANIGAGIYLDNKFSVDNYFVCSVGRILHGAENDVVSFGIFGHVFTFGKEDVKEMLLGKN